MDEEAKEIQDLEDEIKKIEDEIDELRGSWPVHSVKPQMAQRLEELEDELDEKKKILVQKKSKS